MSATLPSPGTSSGNPVPTKPASAVPASYLLAADLLHMGLAALLLNMFLFSGTEVQLLFQLLITGLIAVVMVRGGGWLVLGAVQISLFFFERRAPIVSVHSSTIFLALFCLALVAYATGFRTIRRLLREWLGRILFALAAQPAVTAPKSILTELDARQEQLEHWMWMRQHSWHLLTRFGRLLAIVLVASIAFLQLPFTLPGVRVWWNRTVAMDYMLWPGPNVFIFALVCVLVWTLGSWRRLNRDQARLYLKTQYVRDHFRELRSILVRGRFLTGPMVSPTAKPRPVKPVGPVRKK